MTPFEKLLRFDGKHVVVTGGAHGIGACIAELFVQQGADVTICDVEEEPLLARAKALGARAVLFDQGDRQSVASLAGQIGQVDVLVNNAGALLAAPLLECEQADIDRIFAVDLYGAIELSRLIAGKMVSQGGGVIVNLSSQTAFGSGAGRALYATAKAAVIQFTKAAAAEWGPHGVRVVSVAPGRCLTRMTSETAKPGGPGRKVEDIPLGRWGEPQEPAHAVVFLASAAASYITGATLLVDGGYVIA